jgi:putative ABC transport system substrate-binding protein
MPVIGILHPASSDTNADRLTAFRAGLAEAGYVEGQNVAIEYRWAEGRFERLPELATDLVRRQVTVIAAPASAAVRAAKAATQTIPIVFAVGDDPVKLGLVASLPRPSGNLTGVNFFAGELVAKRPELLGELVPAATRVVVLVNPAGPAAEITLTEIEDAARARGLQIRVIKTSTSREIDAAFETVAGERPDALFVGGDPFFTGRRMQLTILAARHAIPAAYAQREFTEAGGLMSYGTSLTAAWRQTGAYAGRILKGAKPADLPVVQASKFELVINHQTARTLRLTVPDKLLALADEVIE